MSKKTLISIVIPCYNEAGNIEPLTKELLKASPSKYEFEYIFVDDGSSDDSLERIKKLATQNTKVKYLSFTRNFGHQYAIKAGLDFARGQAVISLDADLQHPPALIPEMIKEWEKGSKIVYTKRLAEPTQAWAKSKSSSLFYRSINALSETKIEDGSADFRLLDKEVVEFVRSSRESTLFLRGLVMWSGYSAKAIEFVPAARSWGKSKYSYSRMIHFAIDAITSFSTLPLRLATLLGLAISIFSGLYALYAVLVFVMDRPSVIIGWPSVIISVLFIGGLQLMILGIIGEYLGKVFLETKNRPLYLVKEKSL